MAPPEEAAAPKRRASTLASHDLVDTGITFASGAAYGLTTVAVGQPFDTVKTVVQSRGGGSVEAARRVVAESGLLRGLYRGSVPLVVGGTFMRSAQFGCNDLGRDAIRASGAPRVKLFGVVDSHVVFGGMCGGLGRAIVEGPTEFFKIRQQLASGWAARDALSGLGARTERRRAEARWSGSRDAAAAGTWIFRGGGPCSVLQEDDASMPTPLENGLRLSESGRAPQA